MINGRQQRDIFRLFFMILPLTWFVWWTRFSSFQCFNILFSSDNQRGLCDEYLGCFSHQRRRQWRLKKSFGFLSLWTWTWAACELELEHVNLNLSCMWTPKNLQPKNLGLWTAAKPQNPEPWTSTPDSPENGGFQCQGSRIKTCPNFWLCHLWTCIQSSYDRLLSYDRCIITTGSSYDHNV